MSMQSSRSIIFFMSLLMMTLLIGKLCASEQGAEGNINLRGVVLPLHQSKLGFSQPGIVIELPLEGTEVKKGEVMAKIKDATALEQMAKAKASLAGAQLKLNQAVHTQEKNQRLHKEQILSDMALEEGKFAINQAKISVDQSNSEVASARMALEGTKLTAPFDGVVSRVTAHAGEWVGAGLPVLELVDLTQLAISMDLLPELLVGLKIGQETDVFINGQRAGKGKVRTILPLVDAASGLQRVIWSVTPEPGQVMTGRYVTLGGWGQHDKGGKP